MAKKYKSEHEAFVKMLRALRAKDELEDYWDEALKYNALWDLVTEFLSVEPKSAKNELAMVKEYIDRTIKIMQN
jgi:hypothetical protein